MTLNWGTGIAIVYTTFALATTGFVTFAMGRSVDLVRPDYYAQALRQDDRMRAIANAEALGRAAQIVETGHSVTIVLPHQPAQAEGTITLYRPSNASADRVVPLALDSNRRQEVAMDRVSSGRWIVQVAWTAGGRAFYLERPITVR